MNHAQMIFAASLLSAIAWMPARAQAGDDSVIVFAKLYATPGREAEAEARLLKLIEFVRKSEPNITYRIYHSKKDSTQFMTYEIYPNTAEVDEHMKVVLPAFRKEAGAAPEGLFSRPMEIEEWQEISH
jgi:quinol monooxygenase YgiN